MVSPIIGTSNFLMAHKREFLRTNNRVVVWQNGVIEEVDPTTDLQYDSLAIYINNHGITTFFHINQGILFLTLAGIIRQK